MVIDSGDTIAQSSFQPKKNGNTLVHLFTPTSLTQYAFTFENRGQGIIDKPLGTKHALLSGIHTRFFECFLSEQSTYQYLTLWRTRVTSNLAFSIIYHHSRNIPQELNMGIKCFWCARTIQPWCRVPDCCRYPYRTLHRLTRVENHMVHVCKPTPNIEIIHRCSHSHQNKRYLKGGRASKPTPKFVRNWILTCSNPVLPCNKTLDGKRKARRKLMGVVDTRKEEGTSLASWNSDDVDV